ncbi:MAG: ImmA/IrrE family metallo-endopeptidase [Oscillospiraceae bacterium]|nr:ImmA/IrrE family metallo-endopeptidase [Oscillospiraceae bacterium]
MNQYIASGLSRKDIRDYVRKIKQVTGTSSVLYMNVLFFLENVLPIFIPDLQIDFVEKHEMFGKYAETFPSQSLIRIRQDVYIRADEGSERDRFTIAHEIGHLLLHDDDAIALCRSDREVAIPKYADPEWQANAFAGEFLMNADLIKGMSAEEISSACGSSMQAAEIQLKYVC